MKSIYSVTTILIILIATILTNALPIIRSLSTPLLLNTENTNASTVSNKNYIIKDELNSQLIQNSKTSEDNEIKDTNSQSITSLQSQPITNFNSKSPEGSLSSDNNSSSDSSLSDTEKIYAAMKPQQPYGGCKDAFVDITLYNTCLYYYSMYKLNHSSELIILNNDYYLGEKYGYAYYTYNICKDYWREAGYSEQEAALPIPYSWGEQRKCIDKPHLYSHYEILNVKPIINTLGACIGTNGIIKVTLTTANYEGNVFLQTDNIDTNINTNNHKTFLYNNSVQIPVPYKFIEQEIKTIYKYSTEVTENFWKGYFEDSRRFSLDNSTGEIDLAKLDLGCNSHRF